MVLWFQGNALAFDGSNIYGAILNYSSSFSLNGDTDVIGSVVSKYIVDIQSNLVSITKGNIPEFTQVLVTGLDPFIIPGSYFSLKIMILYKFIKYSSFIL